MKLLIASDIHGSAYYCKELLERYAEEKPDKLILLGDLLYHGPRNDLPRDYDPKQVIAMLNGLKEEIICVRGNCDTEVDQMVLDFPIMADYALVYVDGIEIYLSHGHIYNQDQPIKGVKDILLCGHTHIPACIEKGTFTYLNPGSVAIPKADSPYSYMIYEDQEFIWKDLLNKEICRRYHFIREV